MVAEFTVFEQIVAYLLKAEHNVKLDCMINGKIRRKQFDGYIEELLEDPGIVMKIGIECKKWKSRKVTEKEIAAFSRKIEHCRLNQGIMISYSGFQSGAIDEAGESNIALFEFRPCMKGDFRKGTKIVNFDPIGIGHWHVGAHLRSDTPLDQERELLSSKSFHDVEIYDDQGKRIGKLDKIVSDMIDREMIYHGRKEGTLNIDWSDKRFHFYLTNNGKKIEITALDIDYKLPITEVKPLIPRNWYIMKNVLDNSRRIIMASKVKEIESLFD
jgi:hypothetical protein